MRKFSGLFPVFISLVLLLAVNACELEKVDPQIPPVAAFEFTNDGCNAPCEITFTNQSTSATTYAWDFGDGNTATTASPKHTYEAGGTYQAKLTATGADGQTDDITKTITIQSEVKITAINPNHGKKGEIITLTGLGFGTSAAAVTVKFTSNISATIQEISNTQIKVVVPQGADNGVISVEVGVNTVNGPSFTYDKPVITNFSPQIGRKGDVITLTGNHFGTDSTEITVMFNDKTANFAEAPTNTTLKVRVPSRAGSGSLSVTVSGYEATGGAGTFAYLLSGVVSTFAGSGTYGFLDGPGNTARFAFPYGIAVDAQGNVFVGELDNHRLRKITPAGFVSTFAGGSTSGLINGVGPAAAFGALAGLDFDASGNLIIADFGNNAIRMSDPNASVVTLAGGGSNGASGYLDNFGSSARFYFPTGVAVDASNNVLVADRSNHAVRMITPAGFVSTFAGKGTEAGDVDGSRTGSARFSNLEDLAIDAAGNVYVSDGGNHKIRKILTNGTVTTLSGNGVSGNISGIGTTAQFNNPVGIDIDANGNVFVADRFNNKIRIVMPDGYTYDLAGDGTFGYQDGPGLTAKISGPFGLALDAQGNVYIACYGNDMIRKITVE
ncbi:MAG: IPT/TIG domain-containing protein [Bacteroidia bacterium]|nr:IPT/TIG domain-containing protein [Bacteroidia bacterium]